MPLTPDQVETILRTERENALGVNTAELAEERKTALDYYMGDMRQDMPAPDGRSRAVSSDVSDTIEGLMAPLMDIMASTEEVVRLEPVGPDDVESAEQESDYINHVFMQKNPGFLVLYSFIKDALLSKVGIVKVYWDKYEREERETYENQTDDAYLGLLMATDKEIVSHTEREDEYGARVHDVVMVNKRTYACAKVEPVPPEEFGISKNGRSLKGADYCYHEPFGKTESDLINMGFDKDQVSRIESREDSPSSEAMARNYATGNNTQPDVRTDKSMRVVRVTEHYKRMDYEQNGKPSLYRITTGGDNHEILTRNGKPAIEQIDMLPFAAATPIILTHRFFGLSVADRVIDLQRIKTALVRALLDNTYLANNQRMEVAIEHAHERTIDDLLSVNRPGGIVRTRKPGGLIPIPNNPIGPFVFPMIEYIDATREWRTGVTRQGQGIDANALQNQSATAVNQLFTAAQARVKLIARIIAETGVRDLFALLHATIRKNDTAQNTVRLRNKWVTVDPRNWKTRDDMTINIALGTGSKEQQLAHLQLLLGAQREAIQVGMVSPDNLFNSAKELVKLTGHKNVETFFTPPGRPPDPNNPAAAPIQMPNPGEQEAQGKLQLEQAKAQGAMQLKQAEAVSDAQLARERAAADIQTTREKIMAEGAARMEQMRGEFALKAEQMRAEFVLKHEEMIAEAQLRREQMQIDAQVRREVGMAGAAAKATSIGNVEMGGEPG